MLDATEMDGLATINDIRGRFADLSMAMENQGYAARRPTARVRKSSNTCIGLPMGDQFYLPSRCKLLLLPIYGMAGVLIACESSSAAKP